MVDKKLRVWKKGCSFCPAQIIMKEQATGGWKPFDTDGVTYHKCNPKESYKTIPSNNERDKQMAPRQQYYQETGNTLTTEININDPVTQPAPPPKDPARAKWESRNKEIQEMQVDAYPGKVTPEKLKTIIELQKNQEAIEQWRKEKVFLDSDDQIQILITELTKHTHLLKEINDNLITMNKQLRTKVKKQ